MNEVEHKIQKAIAQYLDLRNLCWWAVPNGGHRNISVARKLKMEGVKAGIPDITLIFDGRYYGIEVKKPKTLTPKGTQSCGGVVGLAYSVSDVQELLQLWGI